MVVSMYETAINLLKKLKNLGYEAYIIGGYPRDLILNIENQDIDICTNALPSKIKELFEVVQDNSRFGSLRIKENNYVFEITTFRIEKEYKGRYPNIEYTNSLLEDLKRRDFTINTICIDHNGKMIDLMGSREDINNKTIKCIGNIELKLKEDPIRILRAIRFMGKLNFELDKELEHSIIKLGYLLNELTISQTKKELEKMNQKSIDKLKELNLNQYLKEG